MHRSRVVITWFRAGDAIHRRSLIELASALAHLRILAVCEVGVDGKGSTRSLSDRCANLTILEMDAMFGRGAALRAGLAQTREDLVAFVDLEASVAPEKIDQSFLALTETDADGVVYDRFSSTSENRYSAPRALLSRLVNRVARAGFGIATRDVRSPLKVFKRSALLKIFEHLRLYAHGFDIDLLLNAKIHGFRIVEVELPSSKFAIAEKSLDDVVSAIAPLLALRLYHSPLRQVPFAELIAARYALPAKSRYGIAIFCWRDPLSPKAGGGEVYLHEQAKWWVRQGCEVTWVAERFPGSPAEEYLDGIRIVRRGRGLAVFASVPLWHLFESKKRYDFIVDVMNGIPFFSPLYSMKPKVCLLYHVHAQHFRDELPRGVAGIAVWIESKLVPLVYRFTRFATISDSTKREMRRLGISKLPIAMIHSGVSSAHVPGRKSAVPTILYVGRVRRYKQIRKLVDAFVRVKRVVPEARLVIAGSGDDLESLEDETRARGIADVTFLGRVEETEKVRLMQEAWVLGMPSQLEGWGIVVIEAAACATPSVAYDVNGLRDCIQDGATGFLAENDEEFAGRLRQILIDSELREHLSAAALRWSGGFSWERTAARTLETIRVSQPWRAVFEPLGDTSWGIRTRKRRSVNMLGELSGQTLGSEYPVAVPVERA